MGGQPKPDMSQITHLTRYQINHLLDVIEECARQAYEQGHTNRGDELYDAFDKLEIWLKKGMSGDFPVDLEVLGLNNIDLSAAEEPKAMQNEQHRQAEKDRTPLKKDPLAVLEDILEKAKQKAQQDTNRNEIDERQMRQKIVELKQKMFSQHISDLDIALQLAREILSFPLDEKMQRDVQRWEAEVQEKRSNLKAKFDEIGTLAALGRLPEAIDKMEDLIRSGALEFMDREGNIVSASDQLRYLNEEYSLFCTQKSREYLERAEKSLPAYPKVAAEVLESAIKEFDKADPDTKDDLQRRLTEIRELINRCEEAHSIILRDAQQRFDAGEYQAVLDLLDIQRMITEGSDTDKCTAAALRKNPLTGILYKLAATRPSILHQPN